jgi:hypothetical protein
MPERILATDRRSRDDLDRIELVKGLGWRIVWRGQARILKYGKTYFSKREAALELWRLQKQLSSKPPKKPRPEPPSRLDRLLGPDLI